MNSAFFVTPGVYLNSSTIVVKNCMHHQSSLEKKSNVLLRCEHYCLTSAVLKTQVFRKWQSPVLFDVNNNFDVKLQYCFELLCGGRRIIE